MRVEVSHHVFTKCVFWSALYLSVYHSCGFFPNFPAPVSRSTANFHIEHTVDSVDLHLLCSSYCANVWRLLKRKLRFRVDSFTHLHHFLTYGVYHHRWPSKTTRKPINFPRFAYTLQWQTHLSQPAGANFSRN